MFRAQHPGRVHVTPLRVHHEGCRGRRGARVLSVPSWCVSADLAYSRSIGMLTMHDGMRAPRLSRRFNTISRLWATHQSSTRACLWLSAR